MEKQEVKIIGEFFSGSKTVAGVFEENGWQSITVDIEPSYKPSLCIDILDLKKNDLPGTLDFLWFSPVCTCFSRAAPQKHWRKETLKYRRYRYVPITAESFLSIAFVEKCIEIINWFPGVPFIIENPVGRIHHTAALQSLGHYRYFVNYFDFGFPYSKETYLFSNIWLPFSLKKYKVDAPGLRSVRSVYQRSKIPRLLISKIFKYLFYYEN